MVRFKLLQNRVAFFITSIALALMPILGANADVGEMPTPGGLITPGNKTDQIRMKAETVTFDVRNNAGVFDSSTSQYAHVTADFTMENLTDQPLSQKLFFPFYTDSAIDYPEMAQTKNVEVKVNQQVTPITYQDYSIASQPNSTVAAGVFTTNFGAKADTEILITYDLRAVHEPKSGFLSFEYVMETGSHWAGTIGSGQVIFSFPDKVDSLTPFTQVNGFFKPKDGKLVWDFSNLEPTADNNITVTYTPAALATWKNRPTYINSLRSSHNFGDTVWRRDDIRTANEGMAVRLDVNPINVLNPINQYGGWLIEQKNTTFDEWLDFGFNGSYTFESIKILPGYADSDNPETHPGQMVYDTFRRPKNITVTFSDGSTQTATLQDQPSQWQTISLPQKATTAIKLSFKDAYPGLGGGNQYFGVGRVDFINAKKAALATNTNSANSAKTAQSAPWHIIVPAIAGVAVLGAGATILAVIHHRRKVHKALQSVKPSPEPDDIPPDAGAVQRSSDDRTKKQPDNK